MKHVKQSNINGPSDERSNTQTNPEQCICGDIYAGSREELSGGQEQQADFIIIVAWRHTAEFVSKYFTKGQLVAAEGSIQTRSYQDKDGNNRTAFEVVADQVYFAEKKNSEASCPTGDLSDFEELDADDGDLPL